MASPNGAPQAPVTSPMILPSSTSYAYGSNEKPESAAYHGSIGKGIRARNVSMNQNLQYAAPSESGTESVNDEMYFDDGGFSEESTFLLSDWMGTSVHNHTIYMGY